MPDVKISALPTDVTLVGADYIPIVDTVNATTKRTTLTTLTNYLLPNQGWTAVVIPAPNTVTALGNRSYSMVFNATDITTFVSNGMRLKTTRTTAAPINCTSLNGTTQYYSKVTPAGMTFTDDFTVSAWVKLSSYPSGAQASIVSRFNGTSGWSLQIENLTGRVILIGFNAGGANNSYVSSYQSIPLNKWVHVTAQLDMSAFTATSTTSYIMIDGVDVPASVARAGTNPTALVQVGDLQVGRSNTSDYFPGKIAQVAIYSAKVTQATILASMNQTLSGTETSLISAYNLSGATGANDLNTTNANNLTANGAATTTAADAPWGGQASGLISSTLDYAIIQSATFSTNTTLVVQVPEGCTIPTSGGVSAVSYATVEAPYGMPNKGKFTISVFDSTLANTLFTNGISNPIQGIRFNAGASSTHSATMYVSQSGLVKTVTFRTAQCPAIASNATTLIQIYYPFVIFTNLPDITVGTTNHFVDSRVSAYPQFFDNTHVDFTFCSMNAAANATAQATAIAVGI